MAFTSGFFNAVKSDRTYNAEQMAEIFDGVLKDGIIPSQGQLFAVTSANNGMQINIGTGRAWFDHTWSKNDSIMVLFVDPPDATRPRIDTVVLEVNHTFDVRQNSIKIVKGDPYPTPVKPTLIFENEIKQYPLAHIRVNAGVSAITASDIENAVGLEPTVFATGVLETVSLTQLWSQWKGDWEAWFANIKLQLTENVVTNLQYQIEERVKIADKASTTEAQGGTNDTKWMTPLKTKQAVTTFHQSASIKFGVYTGTGELSHTITLSSAPIFVLVMMYNGSVYDATYGATGFRGGVAGPGYSVLTSPSNGENVITISGNSFTVYYKVNGSTSIATNATTNYYYIWAPAI